MVGAGLAPARTNDMTVGAGLAPARTNDMTVGAGLAPARVHHCWCASLLVCITLYQMCT